MAANEEIVNSFLGQESSDDEGEPNVENGNAETKTETQGENFNAGETRQCEEECSNRNRNVQHRTENILPLSQTDPRNRIPPRYFVTKASTMVKEDCLYIIFTLSLSLFV